MCLQENLTILYMPFENSSLAKKLTLIFFYELRRQVSDEYVDFCFINWLFKLYNNVYFSDEKSTTVGK